MLQRLLLAVALLITLLGSTGCDTASLDIKDALNWDAPTPTQATQWMFNREPEKRRLGLSLIANAPWGGEDVYVKVYRAATKDVDPMVRAEAVRALGMHGKAADATVVAATLTDSSQQVRWNAAIALQRLHDPAVVPALIKAMSDDSDSDVRMNAADALGQYQDKSVVEALIGALDDSSVAVNLHAYRALHILTGEYLGLDSSKWLDWYRQAPHPFTGAKEYYYPVYTRSLSWWERIMPFGRKHFDSPGIPVGLKPETSSASPPATDQTSRSTKDGNTSTNTSNTKPDRQ